MRRTEAPPAGWYPDPSGGVRLRWWDGADWTNRYRARPAIGTTPRADATGRTRVPGVPAPPSLQQAADAAGRLVAAVDTDALVAQVRQATRAELDRAADVLTARARAATSDLHPLISQSSNRTPASLAARRFRYPTFDDATRTRVQTPE